jgi:hypothetical protein
MAIRGRATTAAIVAICVLAALAPGSAPAASITGTVSDDVTHAGIEGIQVCPTPGPYTFEGECVETGPAGEYTLGGLPPTSYKLEFRAFEPGLNYVREWYGGDHQPPGDSVTLVEDGEAATGIDVELEAGGMITGTATDATTGGPAAGVWVCVEGVLPVFYGTCARANSAGEFIYDDMPTGEYRVEFSGWSDVNYMRRYYKDADAFSLSTKVPVVAGETVSGIDEELYPGAQISGRISDSRTGASLHEARACATKPSGEENAEWCDKTDVDGTYTIRSLPAGSYFVSFEDPGSQWWNGATMFDEADAIPVIPPETVTGIDGALPWYYGPMPTEAAATADPGGVVPPVAAVAPLPSKPRLHPCRKGFHRKLIKGKKRCVRKHRHRGLHRRNL